MKNINKILILMLTVIAFASCETDNVVAVVNPEAEKGTLTFVLNKPMYANFTYVLEEANRGETMETLTTSQPDYGFTAAVTYFVEISFNENMSSSVTLASSAQGETVPINVRDMNMGFFNLYGGNMPNPSTATDIYVRLRAVISSSTPSPLDPTPTVKPLFSNVIKINVLPYFVPNLMPFHQVEQLFPYYIIGYGGDNAWNNSLSGLGTSLMPMSVIEGDHYNIEGQGTFVFTSYFEASRSFKLVGEISNWNIQWGNDGGNGINNPVHNIGGSSNFQVPADGYYTITLNTIDNILSIEAITISPTLFSNMGVVGTINDWGGSPDIAMTPYQAVNNHVWFAEVTLTADDEVKFRYNSDWANNWGATTFPWGIATAGGANIKPTRAGAYMVFFNDLDGTYSFIRR
ncbi:MAG: SusE domain-containing protein [Dysgonamonadaceae bacterium]|jgi:hypothetical protein|nr:SusE domain-containing protein [Dysgonamonadaceae bacterium]